MPLRAAPCDRHRGTLLDLVDRGERGPATDAAVDHLGRCRRCEQELTQAALTIHALRRVRREALAVPVPAVAADRVARLTVRRRDPWTWRLQLGSLAASVAIVAVVVAPRVGVGPLASPAAPALMPDRPAVTASWLSAEARLAASPDSPPVSAPGAAGTLPARYPEGLFRPWKEVFPSDATPRELEPS
jgi:hypothetical protein